MCRQGKTSLFSKTGNFAGKENGSAAHRSRGKPYNKDPFQIRKAVAFPPFSFSLSPNSRGGKLLK